ncbi:MAG TPA: MoxR family ATPase, partial [Gemmatales bacterium]|nr:MoxR family ATPase [Gemmatales bacterium]
VSATRDHDDIRLGASPRASIALFRSSQALAAIRGRSFVLPDDVKRLAIPILAHRLILRPEARLRKLNALKVVEQILSETAVPVPTMESKTA